MRHEWINVDPVFAAKLLSRMAPGRKLYPDVVARLAREMAAGNWKDSHQSIAVGKDGRLLDGQHRMAAIVKSGCTVRMLVAFDVNESTVVSMDEGLKRRVTDVAAFAGLDNVTPRIAGIARRMTRGFKYPSSSILTTHESVEFIKTHWDAISFPCQHIAQRIKRISNAVIGAVFARAWYTIDLTDLERAAAILTTGLPPDGKVRDGDKSIVTLIRTITSGKYNDYGLYRKTENAIQAFAKGEDLQRLLAAKTEQFPLPSEKDSPLKEQRVA